MVNEELFNQIVLNNCANQRENMDTVKSYIDKIFNNNYKKNLYIKGEDICLDGERSKYLYMIERGKVVLTRKDSQGKEYCNGYLLPGDFFGFSSYIDLPEQFNYKALTNCNLYAMDLGELKSIFSSNESLRGHMERLLISTMRTESIRQANLIMGGCRESFVNFITEHFYDFGRLDENGNVLITLDVNLAEIAVILNMTRETLSRIVSEMKRDRIIETKRRFIKILDLPRFVANA